MANIFDKEYWTTGTSLDDRKKQGKFLYHLADNLIGFEDEYETRGEKFGKAVNTAISTAAEDPISTAKAVGQGFVDQIERVRHGPLAYAKEDYASIQTIPEDKWAEMEQEWYNDILGLGATPMAPGAASAAKYEPEMVRMFGGNKPPAYKRKSDNIKTNDYEISTGSDFRDPILRYVQEDLVIPSKGIKGSVFLKDLESNPSIRNPIISYSQIKNSIDPQKRYTKDQLEEIALNHKIDYQINKDWEYENYQRQESTPAIPGMDISPYPFDDEIDYDELVINVRKAYGNKFIPKETHFSGDTVAHTRVSLRGNAEDSLFNGEKYLLVEEIQSDLQQAGYLKRKDIPARPPEEYPEFKDRIKNSINNTIEVLAEDAGVPVDEYNKLIGDRVNKYIDDHTLSRENTMSNIYLLAGDEFDKAIQSQDKITDDFVESIKNHANEGFYETYKSSREDGFSPKSSLQKAAMAYDMTGTQQDWAVINVAIDAVDLVNQNLQPARKSMKATIAPPVKRTKDTTDLAMKAIMRHADANDTDYIVIPHPSRIAALRAGSEEDLKDFLKKDGVFYQTYGNALYKTLSDLIDNYPEVTTKAVTLPYSDNTLPKEALVIDISDLRKEFDLQTPRFAKGGLVTQTEEILKC